MVWHSPQGYVARPQQALGNDEYRESALLQGVCGRWLRAYLEAVLGEPCGWCLSATSDGDDLMARGSVSGGASASEEGAVKPLRCWVSLHSWERMSSADGSGRFRRCRLCGKDDYPPGGSLGNWAAGTFGGR